MNCKEANRSKEGFKWIAFGVQARKWFMGITVEK